MYRCKSGNVTVVGDNGLTGHASSKQLTYVSNDTLEIG
jgi:hypothetical protein